MSIYNGPLAADLAADLVNELTNLREDIAKWQVKERAIITLLEFDPAAEVETVPVATFTAASAARHTAKAPATKAPAPSKRGGGGKKSGLEDAMIREILDRIEGGESATFLAAEFGVSRQTIGNIKVGKGYFEPILRDWEAKREAIVRTLAKGRAKA